MTHRFVWLAGVLVIGYFAVDAVRQRAAYRAFQRQRADWHARCDAAIGNRDHPHAAPCQDELNALLASGVQQGWIRATSNQAAFNASR